MKKYQIIVDSSADLPENYLKDTDICFSVAPLTIHIGDKEFVDVDSTNPSDMLKAFKEYSGKTSTSCPAPVTFADKFDNAEYTFIITISSQLSGSFNAANVAASCNKHKKVHVIDSKKTSGAMQLLTDKLVELINNGLEYEEIVKQIDEYNQTLELYFILQTFDNLVRNGRMGRFAGFIAKHLSIKAVCSASKEGTIIVGEKALGATNAYRKMVEDMKKKVVDAEHKKCIITHCNNEKDAMLIKTMISNNFNFKEIEVHPMHCLTSYYAMDKGLIINF